MTGSYQLERRAAHEDGPANAHPAEGRDGAADPSRVVVRRGSCTMATCYQAHHRDIPERSADGDTPARAAARLAEELERELANVGDQYHRDLLVRALDDVRALATIHP